MTMTHWQLVFIGLPLFVVVMDSRNILYHWRSRVLDPAVSACWDFTLIVPLYGDPKYFVGREELARYYKAQALIAMDVGPAKMKDFADELERDGWRMHRSTNARPTIPVLLEKAFSDGSVTTTYSFKLDADTVVPDGLQYAVEAMRLDGADVCSLKCGTINGDSLCEKMQRQEYAMAMLTRHRAPWLLTGACFAVRTTLFPDIVRYHTGWPQSEDYEAGRVARQLKARIRHLDFTVYTEVPANWRGLWRQRSRGWWVGGFQHFWVNYDHSMRLAPMTGFYYIYAVGVSAFFRILPTQQRFGTLISHWNYLLVGMAVIYAAYIPLLLVVNWRVRSRWLLLMPAYSLLQSTLMTPVGCFYYLRYARSVGNWGRYRFGYRRWRPSSLSPQPSLVLNR